MSKSKNGIGGGYKLLDVDVLDFDALEEGKYKYYLKFDDDGHISQDQFSEKTVQDMADASTTNYHRIYSIPTLLFQDSKFNDYIININNYSSQKELYALYIDVYGNYTDSIINIRSIIICDDNNLIIDYLFDPVCETYDEIYIEGTVTFYYLSRELSTKRTNSLETSYIYFKNGMSITGDQDKLCAKLDEDNIIEIRTKSDSFAVNTITDPIRMSNLYMVITSDTVNKLDYIYPGITCELSIEYNSLNDTENELLQAIYSILQKNYNSDIATIYCILETQAVCDSDGYFLQTCTIIAIASKTDSIPLNGLYKFIRYGKILNGTYGLYNKYNVNSDVKWLSDWKAITYAF